MKTDRQAGHNTGHTNTTTPIISIILLPSTKQKKKFLASRDH